MLADLDSKDYSLIHYHREVGVNGFTIHEKSSYVLCSVFLGLISPTECLEGDHLAFDRYMRDLEDRHPRQRVRLSQQTWLKVTEGTDPVLQELQER